MNISRFSSDDNEFDIADLKARFSFKTATSISFEIGRRSNTLRLPIGVDGEERVWTGDSPFVFNMIGWLDVHHPCDGHIKAHIRVRLPDEYHPFNKMKRIVEMIFKALEIPLDETYKTTVFNSDDVICMLQPIDRNGVSDHFSV